MKSKEKNFTLLVEPILGGKMRTSNPMLKKEAFRKEGASASAMTIGGTVGKTFIMLIRYLQRLSIHTYR